MKYSADPISLDGVGENMMNIMVYVVKLISVGINTAILIGTGQ